MINASLVFPLPFLSWRRMSARFTVSLLAPLGCFCVHNESGYKVFYLYFLISMTGIDLIFFFLLFILSFQYFTSARACKPCHLYKKQAPFKWLTSPELNSASSKYLLRKVSGISSDPATGWATAWFVGGGQRALCWLHALSAGASLISTRSHWTLCLIVIQPMKINNLDPSLIIGIKICLYLFYTNITKCFTQSKKNHLC